MTEAERIVRFLRSREGEGCCDDCLTGVLSLRRRQRAQRVTLPIGQTRDFESDLRRQGPPLSNRHAAQAEVR